MRDRQSTPDTKSHHSQPTKERETQRTTAQEEALVTQQNPLTQTISRMGSAPSAKVHANLLSRATADHLARGRQLMLQMQRQYGNRYVQRVVELSRQGAGETEATPEVEATIEQARGGGRSLDTGIQRQMESAFGTNFSGVRVHTDSTADALNQSLSARAFTTGQDIFFRQGEYNPGSSSGKELLAHELTHVVQQTGTVRGKLAIGEAGDRYEQEADKVASEVLQRLDAPAAVQRQEAIEEELQAKPEITALQRQEEPDEELQAKPSISALQRQEEAKNPNQTGLPDELKAGVENLSGYSLDDVRVHYNSSKPAQLQALAYTQGTEIHVASGQEEHLLHEAKNKSTIQLGVYKEGGKQSQPVPQQAKTIAKYVTTKTSIQPGGSNYIANIQDRGFPGFKSGKNEYAGGRVFNNNAQPDGSRLPYANGQTYQEWDIYPCLAGNARNALRIVTSSDGKFYYTHNHYDDFTEFSI